ncbi:hypothetical protein ACLIA0_14015 [Bacillaceae bacterium W0354]
MKKIIYISIILFVCLLVYFIYLNMGFGNPTAREILNNKPDADIVKLDNLIYIKIDQRDLELDHKINDGALIGEIKKQSTNEWWFKNFYASKLPKGTKLYTTGDQYTNGDAPFIILAKYNDEVIVYEALVEG